MAQPIVYGVADASYQAAGGLEGVQRLSAAFYRLMDELPEAAQLRSMHGPDLALIQDKLACFLCGWLGGPRFFSEKYGPISIPAFHAKWPIGDNLRHSWLLCMEQAIAEQPYTPEFAEYLLRQLRIPAERIVQASSARHSRVD
ncbi:group II truncated hemoglobin [Pseudomonas sp. 5P_3.1_Bac2]|uniref:group II truncated hemoglobin n=1 Tax=Pseudomonas sp. 5P_3.1_Bac2 TaxID=2971617 RepID=UPI0021C74D0A|nr:group II truncated hemoglobin [Pseudomonas sp. 5P_3.1_Bac2]MCU1715760.1 group II truncated hemoglobin [Pseudomonas sp. 5P_3.1_Bac2]